MLDKFFWNVNITENVFSCVSKRRLALNIVSLVTVAKQYLPAF